MSVKLTFEIGHHAARKTKPSKDGFTHDWELFVRGENGSDLSNFVEKVIFALHESFPKPKRSVKEPPYVVKESGYAAFNLSIEIYLKNREEPKKITFDYDLDLQPTKLQVREFIVQSPSDEFRKKCLKGGGQLLDYKSRENYAKSSTSSSSIPVNEIIKKASKRPDDIKPNDKFHEVFGQPLSRSHQNASPIPSKVSNTKDKPSSSLSSSKEKSEKTKHKYSPGKDGKDMKKSSQEVEKVKKDKTKDRERSDKKEKSSKRPSSPSPTSTSSSSARNSTISSSKSDAKSKSKQSTSTNTSLTTSDPAFKKSNKKDKKSDRDRERSELKKDQRKFDSPPKVKDREMAMSAVKDEKKVKTSPQEPKISVNPEADKRQHDKDAERKHKHKKKEKSKDKDSERENKKAEKQKILNAAAFQMKAKELAHKPHTPISEIESDVESPPSIKQDSENSNSDFIHQQHQPQQSKPQVEVVTKKSEKRSKTENKEEKSKKRKKDADTSLSPLPPSKSMKVDHHEKSSGESHSHHNNNNNVDEGGGKMTNEYISELRDLKQKINGIKNNEELQHVVRIIASTGCYEITKSSFDFDLVQLDRTTVQSLLEMFKLKK